MTQANVRECFQTRFLLFFFHLLWPQSDILDFAKSTNTWHVLGVCLVLWGIGGHYTEILPLCDIFNASGISQEGAT